MVHVQRHDDRGYLIVPLAREAFERIVARARGAGSIHRAGNMHGDLAGTFHGLFRWGGRSLPAVGLAEAPRPMSVVRSGNEWYIIVLNRDDPAVGVVLDNLHGEVVFDGSPRSMAS
jgi:hypothetical protein